MKCIAVPLNLFAYAGTLMRASGTSPRFNVGALLPTPRSTSTANGVARLRWVTI